MAKVLVTESCLENIAGSIRRKKNTGETYKVSEMSAAIDSIPTADTTTKNITANGSYNAHTLDNVAGYSEVTVDVPQDVLVSKTITTNGTYDPADDSADGYSSVTVAVEGGVEEDIQTGIWRVWTHSTGGNNAAIYVQKGDRIVATVVYESTTYTLKNEFEGTGTKSDIIYTSAGTAITFDGLFSLKYGPSTSWWVTALDTLYADGVEYTSGETVKSWVYNVTADFYISAQN